MRVSIDKTLSAHVQNYFMQYLINQRHVSPRTVESYRDTFRLLLKFIDDSVKCNKHPLAIADLNADIILEFLDHLETARNNCVRTRNARLAAIHSFMQYVSWKEPQSLTTTQSVLAIPMKRYERPLLGYLTQKEIRALINATDSNTWSGNRDHALITTLYNTGARVSEVIDLSVGSIELSNPSFIRIKGKGRKERTIPIWKSTTKILRRWIEENGLSESDPLFPNRFGKTMTRSGVGNRISVAARVAADACKSLASRKVTPHVIRRSTAMHLLQSGVDLSVIAIWLGHESISTTHHYLEADLEMKKKAIMLVDPPKCLNSGKSKSDQGPLISFLNGL